MSNCVSWHITHDLGELRGLNSGLYLRNFDWESGGGGEADVPPPT